MSGSLSFEPCCIIVNWGPCPWDGEPSQTDSLESLYVDDAMCASLTRDHPFLVRVVCCVASLGEDEAARQCLVLNFGLGNAKVILALRGKGMIALCKVIPAAVLVSTPIALCFKEVLL